MTGWTIEGLLHRKGAGRYRTGVSRTRRHEQINVLYFQFDAFLLRFFVSRHTKALKLLQEVSVIFSFSSFMFLYYLVL